MGIFGQMDQESNTYKSGGHTCAFLSLSNGQSSSELCMFVFEPLIEPYPCIFVNKSWKQLQTFILWFSKSVWDSVYWIENIDIYIKENLHLGSFDQYRALLSFAICEIWDFSFLIHFPGSLVALPLLIHVHFLLVLLAHVLKLPPSIGLGLILDEDLARRVREIDAELKRGIAERGGGSGRAVRARG